MIDLDVTLFHASHPNHPNQPIPLPNTVGIRCLKRGTRLNRGLTRLCSRLGGWRYGLGSDYQTEQTTFAPGLIRALRSGQFDIVHLQDPWLAWLLEKSYRAGHHPARVILAHGTEESADFLARFDYVQHLAPWHLEQNRAVARPGWTVIPNFVDVAMFTPAADGSVVAEARRKFGIPEKAFVIGTSAAVKRDHKRIDFLIEAFVELMKEGLIQGRPPFLLIAGAWHSDTAGLQKMADDRAPGHIKIVTNVPRTDMPDMYRALDLCVLSSLFEMMPISILEALSCGVPVLAHRHPVLEWMVGPGGACVDMTRSTVLKDFFADRPVDGLVAQGRAARHQAVSLFSKEVVIPQVLEMYSICV